MGLPVIGIQVNGRAQTTRFGMREMGIRNGTASGDKFPAPLRIAPPEVDSVGEGGPGCQIYDGTGQTQCLCPEFPVHFRRLSLMCEPASF